MAVPRSWLRGTADDRIDMLYDNAASYINDAGMTWSEFWNTPRRRLDRYAEACNRRVERQRRESE